MSRVIAQVVIGGLSLIPSWVMFADKTGMSRDDTVNPGTTALARGGAGHGFHPDRHRLHFILATGYFGIGQAGQRCRQDMVSAV